MSSGNNDGGALPGKPDMIDVDAARALRSTLVEIEDDLDSAKRDADMCELDFKKARNAEQRRMLAEVVSLLKSAHGLTGDAISRLNDITGDED